MKPINIIRPIMGLIGIMLLPACVWDRLEELNPDPPGCDTTFISFSMDIVPILSNNCFGCHSNMNAPRLGNGLNLEDHPDVAANYDRITGAINHDQGYLAMPRGGDKLDPCTIMKFEAWASAGAPDN